MRSSSAAGSMASGWSASICCRHGSGAASRTCTHPFTFTFFITHPFSHPS